MNSLEITNSVFEDIKHIDENGNEFWYARELQKALFYKEWRKFSNVIGKAIKACESSNYTILEHFVQMDKLSKRNNNAEVIICDYKLSRYACYLIAQNGDPKKKVIALAQTYFAIQTRKQELFEEEFSKLSEDEKRLYYRSITRKGNYNLNKTAVNSGVKDLSKFHNAGYKGLYNGETADDIAKRKGLRYREDILDNMGSSELIINSFRIDQTNQKLINDKVSNESDANNTHYMVGKIVRQAIKKAGGTMPEDLPMPKKSIKQVKKEHKLRIVNRK